MQGVCYIPIASCCTPPAGPARYTYISQGGMPPYRGKVYLRIAGCAPCSTLYPVRTHIPLLGCTVSCFIRPHTPSCMSLYTQAFTPAGKPPLPNRCLTYRSTCHMPHATCGFGDRERFRPHEGLGPLPKLFRTQSTQSLGHSDSILTSPCPSLARALSVDSMHPHLCSCGCASTTPSQDTQCLLHCPLFLRELACLQLCSTLLVPQGSRP